MPSIELNPGSSAVTSASAQVLNSKLVVIGNDAMDPNGWYAFAPFFGQALNLREKLILPVNNLQGITINAYQFPVYERGDITFDARVNLEWRVVFCNPPDKKPNVPGYVSDGISAPLYGWLPASAPMLLIPGVPVIYTCCCAGFSLVSIEVRVGAGELVRNQGQDLVAFSFSASQ
jgi:hypothetical protein